MTRRDDEAQVTSDSERVVREAFDALAGGDLEAMRALVAPDFEWTYLEPGAADPEPQTCHGRRQLRYWVGEGGEWKARPEVEELTTFGDRVLVVTRSPGIDALRARKTGDRNFHVVTVRDGRIAALRACRSREEALASARSATPA
jgi:ketosteroid isomerase-like protein